LVIAPQHSESPFLNWNAVNFGAHTENATGISLYIKGLNGGFDAYYDTLPVHEKIREYIFFTYNCTHGIYFLLFNSLDSLPPPTSGIMAPQDLVLILQRENRLEFPYLLPSLKERILNATDREQAELEFLEWENSQKSAKKDTLKTKRMADLRYLVSKKHEEKRYLLKSEKSFIKPHGYSRLDLGTQLIDNETNAYIYFRPLLHDPSDNSSYYSTYSTLELLSLGLNINDNGVKLRELDLVHIRSAPLHDSLFRSLSWNILASYKNDVFETNFGLGKSFYINEKQKLALEFLLLNSVKCEHNCADFIGFETQLNKRSTGNFRYGTKFEYLRKMMDFDNEHIQSKIWLSYDINRNFNLYAESIYDIKKNNTVGLYMRLYK